MQLHMMGCCGAVIGVDLCGESLWCASSKPNKDPYNSVLARFWKEFNRYCIIELT